MRVRTADDVANLAKRRRVELGENQAVVAQRAGASRKWLAEFEAGKPTAEVGLVLQLLDTLDLTVHATPRDLSDSVDEMLGVSS